MESLSPERREDLGVEPPAKHAITNWSCHMANTASFAFYLLLWPFSINQSINQSSLVQEAWPIWREDTHVKKKQQNTTLYYTLLLLILLLLLLLYYIHDTTSELQCSLITTQLAINHTVKNSPYCPNKTVFFFFVVFLISHFMWSVFGILVGFISKLSK